MLEQLSRPRFFRVLKFPAFFPPVEKSGKFQKPEKLVVLKVVLIFFSPLVTVKISYFPGMD